LRPAHHHPLVAWAWCALILETVFRSTLIAIAHLRSRTYPWERFGQNVGPPELLILIDNSILLTGVILALRALIPKGVKRWAAVLALAALSTVLATKGGTFRMLWDTFTSRWGVPAGIPRFLAPAR
jgi:hypothetical protein